MLGFEPTSCRFFRSIKELSRNTFGPLGENCYENRLMFGVVSGIKSEKANSGIKPATCGIGIFLSYPLDQIKYKKYSLFPGSRL